MIYNERYLKETSVGMNEWMKDENESSIFNIWFWISE